MCIGPHNIALKCINNKPSRKKLGNDKFRIIVRSFNILSATQKVSSNAEKVNSIISQYFHFIDAEKHIGI